VPDQRGGRVLLPARGGLHVHAAGAEAGALPERSFSTELALAISTVAVVVLGVLPGITSTWLSRGGAVFLGGSGFCSGE
jgi:hypothetical protein